MEDMEVKHPQDEHVADEHEELLNLESSLWCELLVVAG